MDADLLIKRSKEARRYAYAPYSNFAVGAALLTRDNIIFTGCNVENAAYGSTICAERVCLVKAVSEGYRDFTAIAIYGDTDFISPCGECRQVLAEFSGDIKVIMGGPDNYQVKNLKDLLPFNFSFTSSKNEE